MSAPGQDQQAASLLAEQLRVAQLLTSKAAGQQSAQEAKDFAAAALSIAQAIVVLDPNRLQGGDTPEARKASVPAVPTRDTDRDGKTGEK